jgi:hypothetical protein
MSKKRIATATQRISESAFDFLKKSVDEIKAHPKYSVIHFANAVELLLKARLMHEHWSLLVDRVSDADLESFLSGKCKTVGPSEGIKRLGSICGQNIPKDAAVQFEKIAAHRNRMIHFFHEAGYDEADPALVEEVVKEQCLCWFHLERLLEQWEDQFALFDQHILRTRFLMRRNQAYLSVAFERLKSKIEGDKKKGQVFHACLGCGYEAGEVHELSDILFEQTCRVCGLSEAYAEIDCPAGCGVKIHIKADHGSDRTCPDCGHVVTADQLEAILRTEYIDPDDYTRMNCALCASLGSVVQHHELYVCVECLGTSDEIAGCEWCNELQMGGGDLEYSYHTGCEFCDGHAGWTRDD